MTGFGRAEGQGGGFDIAVDIRSVNNRYFDCNVRLPRAYLYLEEHIKARLGSHISRGKVDVNVTLDAVEGATPTVRLSKETALAYIAAIDELKAMLPKRAVFKQDALDVMQFIRLSDVLTVASAEPSQDELLSAVLAVLDEAASRYVSMSRAEGENLKRDILERALTIESFVATIESRADIIVARYTERLTKRIEEVLERLGAKADEQRIVTEAAIFADKSATAEETVRLKSHIGQLRDIMRDGGACGKKLDFLIQEFVREANTIGSKANDIETTKDVIEMKNEIEKMREQIQNIE